MNTPSSYMEELIARAETPTERAESRANSVLDEEKNQTLRNFGDDVSSITSFPSPSLSSQIAEVWLSLDRSVRCNICREVFKSPVMLSQCGHIYCSRCIRTALRTESKCPICRKETGSNHLLKCRSVSTIVSHFNSFSKLVPDMFDVLQVKNIPSFPQNLTNVSNLPTPAISLPQNPSPTFNKPQAIRKTTTRISRKSTKVEPKTQQISIPNLNSNSKTLQHVPLIKISKTKLPLPLIFGASSTSVNFSNSNTGVQTRSQRRKAASSNSSRISKTTILQPQLLPDSDNTLKEISSEEEENQSKSDDDDNDDEYVPSQNIEAEEIDESEPYDDVIITDGNLAPPSTLQIISDTSKLSQTQQCPLCFRSITSKNIHIHVEQCLSKTPRKARSNSKSSTKRSSSVSSKSSHITSRHSSTDTTASIDTSAILLQTKMRKTMEKSKTITSPLAHHIPRSYLPSLVYSMLSDKRLKAECDKYGIPTKGGKFRMQKLHAKFTVLFNAECDSDDPRPVHALILQLLSEERQRALSSLKSPKRSKSRSSKIDANISSRSKRARSISPNIPEPTPFRPRLYHEKKSIPILPTETIIISESEGNNRSPNHATIQGNRQSELKKTSYSLHNSGFEEVFDIQDSDYIVDWGKQPLIDQRENVNTETTTIIQPLILKQPSVLASKKSTFSDPRTFVSSYPNKSIPFVRHQEPLYSSQTTHSNETRHINVSQKLGDQVKTKILSSSPKFNVPPSCSFSGGNYPNFHREQSIPPPRLRDTAIPKRSPNLNPFSSPKIPSRILDFQTPQNQINPVQIVQPLPSPNNTSFSQIFSSPSLASKYPKNITPASQFQPKFLFNNNIRHGAVVRSMDGCTLRAQTIDILNRSFAAGQNHRSTIHFSKKPKKPFYATHPQELNTSSHFNNQFPLTNSNHQQPPSPRIQAEITKSESDSPPRARLRYG